MVYKMGDAIITQRPPDAFASIGHEKAQAVSGPGLSTKRVFGVSV